MTMSLRHPTLFRPAALALALAIAPYAAAEEQIQIPGLNMPVAASTQQPQRQAALRVEQQRVADAAEAEPDVAVQGHAPAPAPAASKPRLVQVTPGSADNPAVPSSVLPKPVKSLPPVDTRQDVVVTNGTNTLIPISLGQINRIVTPFEDPKVQTVSDATIETSGNVIYVTTTVPERPVTMYVTPADDESVAISLTLFPQDIPPIQANLIFSKSLPGAAQPQGAGGIAAASVRSYSGQAKKWERSMPYMETLRELLRQLALGNLPRGYSMGAPANGGRVPACAQPNLNFDFSHAQLLEGHDFRVFVATVENISARTVEFDYADCTHPNRAAVSVWPNEVLEPGQKSEVYVVTRVPVDVPDTSVRPSLLN
ncbi:type-F conjugative transfer system secretin TraK [Pseudomonas sp. DP-17]|uniref:TraK domain-containing protein n=1 Tax=Pseudomonas sp. DP-17 TaxID=1580486 RepID=UPI001EFBC763|nr:type-F conjugative transfer system secretin TraK [Pseudomonas sp. DP-17]